MNYIFEGVLTEKDVKQHIFHPFEVPVQTTQLDIHLHFTPARLNNIDNMLCLTLFDPQGFRGAGHRGGDTHQVQLSFGQATPGYRPGPLPAGSWLVEIDTHMVLPGEPCRYRLAISLVTTGEALPQSPEPTNLQTAAPVRRGPDWYRGDLHSHTLHSDAQQDVEELIETARRHKLDFIILTDHNTVSGLAEMEQRSSLALLTLGGQELTTFWGHALCLGSREWLDWRTGLGTHSMAGIAAEVTANGQLFIIAHPCSIGDPFCTGCDWRYEALMPGSSHFVEIWNGPWGGDSNNEPALQLWYGWLNQGHRLVATAGSDTHRPEDYTPTTAFNIIYAQDLGEAVLFQALHEGHLYLSSGPHLALTAVTREGQQAMMGDRLASNEATFAVTWQDCPATAQLQAIAGGEVLLTWPAGQGSSRSWTLTATQAHWCLVEVRAQNGELLAITNPIFIEAG